MKKSPDDYNAKAPARKPAVLSQEEQDRLAKEKIKQERKAQTAAASGFRVSTPGVQHISSTASKPAYDYAKAGGNSVPTESWRKHRQTKKESRSNLLDSLRQSSLKGYYDNMIDEHNLSSGSIGISEPAPASMCDRVIEGDLKVSLRSSSIGGIYDDMTKAVGRKSPTIFDDCDAREGDDGSGDYGVNNAFSNYKIRNHDSGDYAPDSTHAFVNDNIREVDDESGSKRPKKIKHRKKSKEEGSSKSRRSRRTIANVDNTSKPRFVNQLTGSADLNGDDDELTKRIMEKLREKERREAEGHMVDKSADKLKTSRSRRTIANDDLNFNGDDDELTKRIMEKLREKDRRRKKKDKKKSRKSRIKEIEIQEEDDDSLVGEEEEEKRRELLFSPGASLHLFLYRVLISFFPIRSTNSKLD